LKVYGQHDLNIRQVEKDSLFLTMTLQNAFMKKLLVEPRSMAIAKRGECTFVNKAKNFVEYGADAGMIVNADNEVIDMPAGKERTVDCTVPTGLLRQDDGEYSCNLLLIFCFIQDGSFCYRSFSTFDC
jgi:hypothetical protein